MPLAETQMPTVLSNAAPDGKGRVPVRMNWQTDGMQTGWVRVRTPDGGSSSDVKSNRGFVFIPEVGDHVLVGFRHGDPSRPYVMGSLFNGFTGKGGGKGNNCKSLTTRSGSSLMLNDSKGSVTLHDKGGVKMNFDGNGNLTATSRQSHVINSGNATKINVGGKKGSGTQSALSMDNQGVIDLTSKKSITLKVGSSILTMSSDGNIKISCKKFLVDSSIKSAITANKSMLHITPLMAKMFGNSLSVVSSDGQTGVISKTQMTIASASDKVLVNGASEVSINASKVKLNS